jgi:hypothetical protein
MAWRFLLGKARGVKKSSEYFFKISAFDYLQGLRRLHLLMEMLARWQ